MSLTAPCCSRSWDLSAADASINCWNDKYYWGFWRPMAAIREADTDDNPATEQDTSWAPLFTPPYPDHPSGHLCMSSSSLHALQAFCATDEIPFYVTSSQFPGEQRHFERFSDAINELIEARIWAGLRFRNADVQASDARRAGHPLRAAALVPAAALKSPDEGTAT